MRVIAIAAVTLLLGACATGPDKPPSCDGTNLKPVNAGYPSTYAEYLARRKAANAPPEPKGSAALSSPKLNLSVVIDKDALVLVFAVPPASLFITDRKSGASIADVDWVSENIIRMPLVEMREVEFKTSAGTYAIKVEGGQLYEARDGSA